MKGSHSPKLPKTLYMLWLQGWDHTPKVVAECRRSWEYHNPGWRIVLLDEHNLFDHVDQDDFAGLPEDMSPASMSDVVRVHLLKHGGVWVDATCFCCMPLDDWIHEHMGSGFFAFDRPGKDRMISTWFLAAVPGNELIDIFGRATRRYWRGNPGLRPIEQASRIDSLLTRPRIRRLMIERSWLWHSFLVKKVFRVYSYFWVHFLFGTCYRRKRQFRAVWDRTPKVSALIPHRLLHHGLGKPLSAGLKLEIARRYSPLYKLSWRLDGDPPPGVRLEYCRRTLGTSEERRPKAKEHYVTRSDTNRILYFINPKCACTSLKAFVATNDDQISIDVARIGEDGAFGGIDKTEDITPYRDYFKFSFVRNPWDRLVSCYVEKVVGQGRWADVFGKEPSFENFVRTVAAFPDESPDCTGGPVRESGGHNDISLSIYRGRWRKSKRMSDDRVAHRIGSSLGHYRKSDRNPPAYYTAARKPWCRRSPWTSRGSAMPSMGLHRRRCTTGRPGFWANQSERTDAAGRFPE